MGSEMCIRDRVGVLGLVVILFVAVQLILGGTNEIYPGTIPEFILKVI